MSEHLLPPGLRSAFVHGGNAVFTVVSSKTQRRYTYKIRKPKGKKISFVELMDGPDNIHSYKLIGIITEKGKFFIIKREWANRGLASHKAIWWFMSNLESDLVDMYHAGKCGRCGRRLTVPESITIGIGPECAKKLGK